MKSIWKSLLWKEWREQRWRLVALTALIGLPAIWFFYSITAENIFLETMEDYFRVISGFANCYLILAGCFMGMHIAGGENSRRTMQFMQALPTPMWQTGLVKLLVGCFVALMPLVLLYGCVYIILPLIIDEDTLSQAYRHSSWHVKNWFAWSVMTMAVGILGAPSLILWMAAAGVNRSDEIRAGAFGFLVCTGVWLPSLFLFDRMGSSSFIGDSLELMFVALPGGPGFIPVLYQQGANLLKWILIISALVISHGAILTWYLKRFGRVAMPPKRAKEIEFDLFRWRRIATDPMRSPWRAIAWKQLRETGPLAAIAVAGILTVVPVIHYFNGQGARNLDLGELLLIISLSVGFFVILVAGIGVFIEDFAPGVNNFWRSRPINVNRWFVVKFGMGIIVLFAAFGTLFLLAAGLLAKDISNVSQREISDALFASYALVLLYTLALASYCLLRQPIYAAVLTFGLFLAGMMSSDWLFPDPSYLKIAVPVMIFTLAIPFTIAWLAVKHDWGWKAGR